MAFLGLKACMHLVFRNIPSALANSEPTHRWQVCGEQQDSFKGIRCVYGIDGT